MSVVRIRVWAPSLSSPSDFAGFLVPFCPDIKHHPEKLDTFVRVSVAFVLIRQQVDGAPCYDLLP
ncbi:MAG: hypothetical protein ABIQ51_10855, partial [Mesorhizobium sp.]